MRMLSSRVCIGLALTTIFFLGNAANAAEMNEAKIEQMTGLQGKYSKEENVFKISQPRTDVKVLVNGRHLPPFMGLTSWAAFTPAHRQTMMMGDTVVFEDEVNPAMSAAFDAGLEVTALHNHFFFDQPKVYFMHIGGMGDEAKLAQGVRNVYDKIAQIRKANPAPQSQFAGQIPAINRITVAPLEQILGGTGETKDGMAKFSFGRPSSMHGAKIGNAMGVNTWAAFAGTDDQAIVDGDFAMLKDEMQAVLRAMRQGGINVVAIHQHMTEDQPHYFFMHYWGQGKATELATVIKKALDTQTHN